LSLSSEEIPKFLDEMAIDSRAITKEVAEICFYMNGSITWDQAWNLTSKQKTIIRKIIKDNMELMSNKKII